MSVKELNESNFEEEVMGTNQTVLVDFYADWCGPCKMMSPIIDQISEEGIENLKVTKINVDNNQDLAVQYDVMSIPTIMIFKEGKLAKSFVGVTDKETILNAIK